MQIELRRALLVGAAVVGLTWGGRASGSGFQLVEQNGSGLGRAYAGEAAAAEDASTIFFNPAGMTLIPGRQVVASVSLIDLSFEFQDSGSTGATLQSLGGDGGDAGGLTPVPNAYLSWEVLPEVLWTGLGVNVPFGLKTEWNDGWTGRFHALKSEVQTININPALALKLHRFLSIGAGVNYQWVDAELTNAVNYSAIAFGVGGPAALGALAATCPGAGPTGAGCEGVGTVEGDDWSWGWNVGAMIDLPTRTRIGLSYRAKIKHEIEGTVAFGNRPALLAAGLPDGDISAEIELPETLSVAVAQQVVPSLQLLADFTWTGWSSIEDLDIFRASGPGLTSTPLQFEDSWRIGLGADYQLAPAWKVRGGVAYDKSPVEDEFRTPRLPDDDRTWVSGGAQWAFSRNGAIDVGLAYLFVSEPSSNLPNLDPAPPAGFQATPKGALVGTYDASVWIGTVQARYSF